LQALFFIFSDLPRQDPDNKDEHCKVEQYMRVFREKLEKFHLFSPRNKKALEQKPARETILGPQTSPVKAIFPKTLA